MNKVVIGVDIGGTTIKFGMVSTTGNLLEKWSIPTVTSDGAEKTMENIASSISEHLGKPDLIGIGIDVPGSVRPSSQEVYDCNNLGWIEDTDVRSILGEEFNVPVVVENDANAAALGEEWQGAGTMPNILDVTLGTGVGSGLILNNKLMRGASGASGEIGHVIVDPNGFLCTCGNRGCLETVSSATGIVRLYRKEKGNDSDELITSKEIFDKAKKGSPLELKVVNKACEYLGLALANATNLLNLDEIIIGGGVSNAGEFLRERIEDEVNKRLFKSNVGITHVKLASLGNDAGILGICYRALSEVIIDYPSALEEKGTN